MFWIKDKTYAKVWEVKAEEKYTRLSISTSEKDKDGNRVYSHWNAICFGKVHDKAKDLKGGKDGDFIEINTAKITNVIREDKEGKKNTFLSVQIIDFNVHSENGNKRTSPTPAASEDDEFPFL